MDLLKSFRWDKISTVVIESTLIVLFFLVPLLVVPSTQELFEFNKMYLTYGLAAILFIFELVKLASAFKPQVRVNFLFIPGLIFLAALTLATIFSIDRQVSFFGFYGRFHGGLWSWISYGVIFFSLSQLTLRSFFSLIKISLISGFLVASWGILEHFGIDSSYWVQDVKSRVFSSLGQPNWLAAYLAMLLPWSIVLYLISRRKIASLGLLGLNATLFTCFIFTYSRGGNYGLAVGLAGLLALTGIKVIKAERKKLALLTVLGLLIIAAFASPLTSSLLKEPPHRSIGTLESGDETGNIRLIVWKGAWEIFQHHPVLGTGLETFGESYYQYRPTQMNKTSEWDFLFNKAHNEYLNYLATTGLVGTIAYLGLIGSFILGSWKLIRKTNNLSERLLMTAGLASVLSYLVQNIFSFTVVPLAFLFILNLGGLAVNSGRVFSWSWPVWWSRIQKYRPQLLLFIPLLATIVVVMNLWRADILYTSGASDNDYGNPAAGEVNLIRAVNLNPFEPNYLIQLAFAEANQAELYLPSAAGSASTKIAISSADTASRIAPFNLAIWRLRAQVYEQLSQTDTKYWSEVESSRQRAVELAPTEPRVRLELAGYFLKRGQIDLALDNYLISLKLKDDFGESLNQIIKIYLNKNDRPNARIYLDRALKLDPANPELLELARKVQP